MMENNPVKEKVNPVLGAVKGAIIAIGAVLPGISGGALCVILGIYKRIMALLCHPIREIKKQWKFFVPVGIGFVVGTLLSSKVIGGFMEAAETAALFLFIGLILGTLPSLFKEAGQQGASSGSYVALFIAAAAMLAWMIPMSLTGSATVAPSFGWWCACGVLWGLGIVVPGMSPSNIFFVPGAGGSDVQCYRQPGYGRNPADGRMPGYNGSGSFQRGGLLPAPPVFHIHARGAWHCDRLHHCDSPAR